MELDDDLDFVAWPFRDVAWCATQAHAERLRRQRAEDGATEPLWGNQALFQIFWCHREAAPSSRDDLAPGVRNLPTL